MPKKVHTHWLWGNIDLPWSDSLIYDAKTGDFEYSARHKDGHVIMVLKGTGNSIKQAERNRARQFVYRLVDTLNVCTD